MFDGPAVIAAGAKAEDPDAPIISRTQILPGFEGGEIASWPVSRVLYGPDAKAGTWQPFIWDNVCTLPLATHPDDWPGNRL